MSYKDMLTMVEDYILNHEYTIVSAACGSWICKKINDVFKIVLIPEGSTPVVHVTNIKTGGHYHFEL